MHSSKNRSYLYNKKRHLFVVIIVAIGCRVMVAYFIGNSFQPRTWEYEVLTQNMLNHGEYVFNYREYGEYKALLAPGYSFLTYAVYKVFGTSHIIMLLIQFFLMSAFCIIIYNLSELLFKNRLIAFISGVLVALHPGLIYYSSTILHQLNLYIFLFYASVYLMCLCYLKGSWMHFILLGIVGGCAVLTRATICPVILLSLAIYIFINRNICLKKKIVRSATVLIILICVNAPWTIRNYIVLGKPIFSQTNKWESFWVGNNSEATGGHFKTDGTIVLQHKPQKMQEEINASDNEIKDNEIFKKYAFNYIKENPTDFIYGLLRKGTLFWWFYPQTGILYPKFYLVCYKIIYLIMAIFTVAGLVLCHLNKMWRTVMVFPLILVLGIWGVHTINFMEMRHRWTVEPVMILFASVAVYYIFKFICRKFMKDSSL